MAAHIWEDGDPDERASQRGAAAERGSPQRQPAGHRAINAQRLVNEAHQTARRTWSTTARRPKIEIDPETYAVTADGELLVCEPAENLAMAQRYFLFPDYAVVSA